MISFLFGDDIRLAAECCNYMPLNNLDKAGNHLGTGIGIVFVLLGRRIVDGKPGVSGRGTSPGSVFHRARKE